MLKAILISSVAFFSISMGHAQDYRSAGGVRLSYGGLLSYKHALNDNNYLEGILSVRWNGVVLTGIFEWQESMGSENFFWYGGGGIHAGIHGRNNTFQSERDLNDAVQINLGMDLIGGVEYVFENIPIVVSADYKPAFYFTGDRWLVPEEFGLTARYIFDY